MTEQPDTDRATYLAPADFARLQASLDEPPVVNERLRAAAQQTRAQIRQTPTPDRDGYTIGVYLPPGVSGTVRDQLFDTIADAVHAAEDGQDWDAHVVGVPGDPLGTCGEPDAEDQAYEQAMRGRKRGGSDEDRIAETAARAVENNHGLSQQLADS